MWVGDDYKIKTGDHIDLILTLSGMKTGQAGIKFRLTTYNAYFRTEDKKLKEYWKL